MIISRDEELRQDPLAWALIQESNGRVHGACTSEKYALLLQQQMAQQMPDLTGATKIVPLYARQPDPEVVGLLREALDTIRQQRHGSTFLYETEIDLENRIDAKLAELSREGGE